MVIVIEVMRDSLAEKAGFRVGDRIESINGVLPENVDHAIRLIRDSDRSVPLIFKCWRNKKEFKASVDFKKGKDRMGVLLIEPIKMDRMLKGVIARMGRMLKGLVGEVKDLASALTEELPPASDNPLVSIPKMNIFWVLFLYAVTFTVYEPIWYLRRRKSINSLNSRVRMNPAFPLLLLIVILVQIVYGIVDFNIGARLSWVFSWAFSIIIAFNVRKMLADHLKSKVVISTGLSVFLTFLFRFLYLQYKINRQSEKILC